MENNKRDFGEKMTPKALAYLSDWYEAPKDAKRDTMLCGEELPEVEEAEVF